MRYAFFALLARYLPHRAWLALPEPWRWWWAGEWVKRRLTESRDRRAPL